MLRYSKLFYQNNVILLVILLFLVACKSEPPISKWENGIIPYYLKGNFTQEDLTKIKKGMSIWENAAGVKFNKVTPRSSAYRIEKVSSNKWQSSIGENNSVCYMFFGNGGNALEHITHELGHTLGLLHEHQRPDRDKYINIFWENIQQSFSFNFEKKDNPLITESDYPYDYKSIMHYSNKAFSINGEDTISTKDPSKILKRDIISEIDIKKAREIYGPPLD